MKTIPYGRNAIAALIGASVLLSMPSYVSAAQVTSEAQTMVTSSQQQPAFNPAWAKTSDGQDIYFEDTRGEHPVIFFQSGFMGIHDLWKNQVTALHGQYRTITHDRRGYGLSSSPDDAAAYSVERNADDMKAVLDAAGISKPVYIVTHSMGSADTIAFAIKYPEMVKGIIMAGGASLSGELPAKSGGTPDMFAVKNKTPQDSMNFFHGMGLEKEIAVEAGKWSRSVFRNQTVAILNYKNDPAAAGIKVPVLVLQGDDDAIQPLKLPQEIVDTLPDARMEILPGVKHFPPTEAPDVVNNTIRNFIKQHP